MTAGKYRVCYGARIIDASYDYDTHTIGPYVCPIDIGCYEENYGECGYSDYQFYELFREFTDLLAIFVVNNMFFCCIHDGYIVYRPFISTDERSIRRLPSVPKNSTFPKAPSYEHIGYIKTYHQNKNVFAYPDYLVRRVDNGEVPYVSGEVTGVPLLNPPVSLYKELLKTNNLAVYFDTQTGKPVFLN